MAKNPDPVIVIIALVIVFGMFSFIKPAAITFIDNTTTTDIYYTGQPPSQIQYGSGGGGGGGSTAPLDPDTTPTQTTPVDPLPPVVRSANSLALLSTISSLNSKSTQKVIVGQHMEHGWEMWAINDITKTTGKQLMLIDGDYVEAGGGIIQYTAVNKNLINHSKQGGMVSLTVYTPNPNTRTPKWNSSRDRNISFDNLMNRNSTEYSNFRYYLAQIGDGIAQLQAANVTVLIRPFHEMNGGWNWWGKRTDVQYKFLWNETYNYLARERGFNNMIFVYAPNGRMKGDTDPGNYLYYYPGDTVDLVGLDYYSDFPEDMDITGYNQLTSIGKPFGFAEIGPKVRVAVPANTFDNKRYIDVIKSIYPLASWALFWSGPSGLHSQLNVGGLLNDSWVITLGRYAGQASTAPLRDPLQQPFASTSIWNMPIGSNAVYVFANISRKSRITADPDIIVLTPNAPLTEVHFNDAYWSRLKDRCTVNGTTLFIVPVPVNYIVSNGLPGTPNNAAAILLADNRTIRQFQPFTRCIAGGGITSSWKTPLDVDIYGDGILGAHGGSKMSSIGGTIRLGELTKTSKNITHVLKINLYSATDLSPTNGGFRWPAAQADYTYSTIYKGKVPASRMGSLYAIPPTISLASLNLQTEPGRRIAWTMQNYGAYVVDDTAWNANGIETELGPAGDVQQEFQAEWEFSFESFDQNSNWVKDINKIFDNLYVVDNNYDPGTIGGGGTPLQPLAAPLGGS